MANVLSGRVGNTPITAYGAAKARGYTGTLAEFEALMASYATVAQEAAQSASTASTASTTATAAATTASTAATAAATSATNAATSESNASASAESASASATTATTAAATATSAAETATSAVSNFSTAVDDAIDEVNTAGVNCKEMAEREAENAEAWAVGQRDGADVGVTDDTYHNNAKYYATQASGSASSAATSESNAATSATNAATSETNAANSATAAQSAADTAADDTAASLTSQMESYVSSAAASATAAAASAASLTIDTEPTEGSTNGISSGAVYALKEDLDDNFNDLESAVSKAGVYSCLTAIQGKYINSDGNVRNSAAYAYIFVPYISGNIYIDGASNDNGIINLFDSSKQTVLWTSNWNTVNRFIAQDSIPTGTAYLSLSFHIEDLSSISIYTQKLADIPQIQNDILTIENTLESMDVNIPWYSGYVYGSKYSWENKKISANTGSISNATNRLKNTYPLPKYIYAVEAETYQYGIFAYLNDTFVGWWNGTAWVTTNIVWKTGKTIMPHGETENTYDIYMVFKKSDDSAISATDAASFAFTTQIKYITGELEQSDYTNYAIASDFCKKKITLSALGRLTYAQSFLMYDGKYYSTDGSNIAVQDVNFSAVQSVALSVGHGNGFCLGNSNKGYISGWSDQKVYVVNLDTLTLDSEITLPTTGYTTCAVDDVKGLIYIFQRDDYPSTKARYNLITYDYVNQQIINTVQTSAAYAAMQACDIYRDRIIVLYGTGIDEKPNAYIIYNTNGQIEGEYIIGDHSAEEPEGVFIDRNTQEVLISYNGKVVYRIK